MRRSRTATEGGRVAAKNRSAPGHPALVVSPSDVVGLVRVAAERKISDEELGRLRHLHDIGWAPQDLAEAFGVTVQHVGRLVRGEQRPVIAGLDAEAVRSGVAGA